MKEKIVKFFENKKVATRETLQLFSGAFSFFCLGLIFKYIPLLSFYSLPFLIIALGTMGNLYVIDFNNFRMPVLGLTRRQHKLNKKLDPNRRFCKMDQNTKLPWLADIFPIGKNLYSLGDFMIYGGLGLVVLPYIGFTFFLMKQAIA